MTYRLYPPRSDPDTRRAFDRLYDLFDTKPSGNGGSGLTDAQLQSLLNQAREAGRAEATQLLGAFGQPLVGDVGSADPLVTPITQGGTVTSFSAGDLSPLFTTTEATPTTTPALSFAQIVQNANLLYAGPTSGVAANPTFRVLNALDTQLVAETMLASVSLNLNTNTKQSLYTVPTGKSAIITKVIARSPSVDLSGGATTNLSFGFNAGANDWANATLGTALLTASTLFLVLSQEFALGGSPSTIGASTRTFSAITDAAFGSAATVQIEVFGHLF